jgi:hypothetical protein
MCIMSAAGVIILQSMRGVTLRGERVTDEATRVANGFMSSFSDTGTVLVPEGLAGERAMQPWRGCSDSPAPRPPPDHPRARAGRLAPVGKSDRVHAGSMLDVTIPAESDPLEVVPEIVEGIKIIHDDDAIVVIDKPVGSPSTPRRAGLDRPSWGTSQVRGSGSPPPGPGSARASSSASTSGPRASW